MVRITHDHVLEGRSIARDEGIVIFLGNNEAFGIDAGLAVVEQSSLHAGLDREIEICVVEQHIGIVRPQFENRLF